MGDAETLFQLNRLAAVVKTQQEQIAALAKIVIRLAGHDTHAESCPALHLSDRCNCGKLEIVLLLGELAGERTA